MMGGVGFYPTPPKIDTVPIPTAEADCDEWIAAMLKLPRGALAKLYRVLHDGEGLRLDNARGEERKWRDSFKKGA